MVKVANISLDCAKEEREDSSSYFVEVFDFSKITDVAKAMIWPMPTIHVMEEAV